MRIHFSSFSSFFGLIFFLVFILGFLFDSFRLLDDIRNVVAFPPSLAVVPLIKFERETWMNDKNTEKACSSCYRMSKTLSFCSFVPLSLIPYLYLRQRTQNAESLTQFFHLSSFVCSEVFTCLFLQLNDSHKRSNGSQNLRKCKTKVFHDQMFLPDNPRQLLGFLSGSTSCYSNERYDRFSCSLAYNCLFIILWNNRKLPLEREEKNTKIKIKRKQNKSQPRNKHAGKKLFPVWFYRSYHIIFWLRYFIW